MGLAAFLLMFVYEQPLSRDTFALDVVNASGILHLN